MKDIRIFVLLLLLIISCTDSLKEPIEEIDESLVGTWYYKSTDSTKSGPKEIINGIQIEEDGKVNSLAILTSSGDLAHLRYKGKISFASNNQIKYKSYFYQSSFGALEKEYLFDYKFEGETLLFLSKETDTPIPFHNSYLQTYSGDRLAEPILSYFSSRYKHSNNKEYRIVNNPINSAPSAYSYDNNDSLIIESKCDNKEFYFGIDYFNGIGKYDEKSVKVYYYELNDDIATEINSAKDNVNLSLFVLSIDDKRISGTFEMTILSGLNFGDSLRFTEGEFSIPRYK